MMKPMPPNPELDRLLAEAKARGPLTPAEIAAQRRSWVVGEMMLEHPDMNNDEANALYDTMLRNMGYSEIKP
jgi:hypothetical protein